MLLQQTIGKCKPGALMCLPCLCNGSGKGYHGYVLIIDFVYSLELM